MKNEASIELNIQNLCCANCAAKIERHANNIKGVNSVTVDMVSEKIICSVDDAEQQQAITQKIIDIAKEIEPDVKIAVKNSENLEDAEEKPDYRKLILPAIGACVYISAFLFGRPVSTALFIISYLMIGYDILLFAVRNIIRGQIFDENFLMAIASIAALCIGQYPEGTAVMLFYKIGEMVQDAAVNHSRKSIRAMLNLKPEYANLKTEDGYRQVAPDEVSLGSIIIVKPGEKVPLDGTVVGGSSSIDNSALTGESMPHYVESGSAILSGSINKESVIEVEVTKVFADSTATKILEMVQNASSKKAKTEQFITKFARYYTPCVVLTALVIAVVPPLFMGEPFSGWIYRGLIFLVVSCPCALVLSIPLSFFGGIGGASKNGILVKGGNYLETLNGVKTVIFDKTGTLTEGKFQITGIHAFGAYDEDSVLRYAAHIEYYSNHPLALSVCERYSGSIYSETISDYVEYPGLGISARIGNDNVIAGNVKLFEKMNITVNHVETDESVIYIAVNGSHIGSITLADIVRPGSMETVSDLKKLGMKHLIMLTGDRRPIAEKVAGELGISQVYSELLPSGKVEMLEKIKTEYGAEGRIAFIGDGLNDAPVLASADIGVTMGSIGSDAAIEASDIVLMHDEPYKLVTAYKVSQKTRKIVTQNIVFALGVKGLILALGVFGAATIWEAVFGDVGVALIAILNSVRAGRV